jgi:phosphate/sulfate permease
MFGWPLMWPTISTEGTDCFDALSRAYAYVFQRPLHYLFYAVVAALFGAVCWLLVGLFANAVVELTFLMTSWVCGAERIAMVRQHAADLGSVGGFGSILIHWFVGCVQLLAVGFLFSYFWAAATAVYLLLRRDVDATEMDEVALDEEEDEESYGLPPLGTDASGAPTVGEEEKPAADKPEPT